MSPAMPVASENGSTMVKSILHDAFCPHVCDENLGEDDEDKVLVQGC